MKAKLFLTGLALAVVLVLIAQAQERPKRPGDGPSLLPRGILENLDLSGEQKEKVAKLNKEFLEKIEPAKKKHDEAMAQARQDKDRRKAQEAEEAFRREVGPIHQAFGEKLGQVLSEEQRRRLGELSRKGGDKPPFGGPHFDLPRILGQLELSAEQKDKIGQLMKEFAEKHEGAKKKLAEAIEQARQNQDREKARELFQAQAKEMGKLHEEILGKVRGLLTEEQRRRFASAQPRKPEGFPPGLGHVLPPPLQERLGLSPEQREKIGKLQKDTEVRLREILNEEQNKKLDELKKGGGPQRPKPRKE